MPGHNEAQSRTLVLSLLSAFAGYPARKLLHEQSISLGRNNQPLCRLVDREIGSILLDLAPCLNRRIRDLLLRILKNLFLLFLNRGLDPLLFARRILFGLNPYTGNL